MNAGISDEDIENILLSDLLNLYGLDLVLSSNLLNLEINSIFKEAHLEVQNEIYTFTINGSSITIDASNHDKTVMKSQEARPSEGLPFGSFCCYGWDGSITSIS